MKVEAERRYTRAEAARLLGIGIDALYQAERLGTIQGKKEERPDVMGRTRTLAVYTGEVLAAYDERRRNPNRALLRGGEAYRRLQARPRLVAE